jgi:hypothetical protein
VSIKNPSFGFTMEEIMSHVTKVRGLFRVLLVVAIIAAALSSSLSVRPVYATAGLSVEVVAAPNIIVDSNVLSPSTRQPIVATVIGKFCNASTAGENLTNVVGRIGNGTTAGTYPQTVNNPTFSGGGVSTTYRGQYSFTHLGNTADATRQIGTLAPGQCSYQYWSFTYPKTAINNADGLTIPSWGTSVKPGDDLALQFVIWGSSDQAAGLPKTNTMTMRNEISAMANKIEPNGNPSGQWFNTDTSTINPGETVTTNGILYRLGNINQGFDNDGNGVPDYNAWVQPFGDPSYDPNCFRLVETTGVLTVSTTTGDVIIPFKDSLYFTDLPQNNTNAVGLVFYKFLALGGACTIPITPYQEVASGSDNEKFNGDYGAGPAPVGSYQPKVTVSKTAPGSVNTGATFTYQIPFTNTSTTSVAGLTISSGGVDMPLVVSDTVPTGLQYVCGSAATNTTLASPNTATLYYSNDSGATWSTTEPASICSTPSTGNVKLMWKLNNPLPKSPEAGSSGNYAGFQATVPTTYITGGGNPFIQNCADTRFGVSGAPFALACAVTMVNGTGQIGDRVWADVNGDGAQTGESGISAVTVYLYWDKNNDNLMDSGDVLVAQQNTSGVGTSNYNFTNLPPGEYVVKVDASDSDIPAGYSPTTVEFYAVTLAVGQIYTTADFGFGPTLRLEKELTTPDPAVVDENVSFHIHLVNTRPGDGTPNGFCTYYVWPSATSTDGTANKQFSTIANAVGAPDGLYSSAGYGTGGNRWIGGSAFSSGGRTSGITSVKAVMNAYLAAALVDDSLDASLTGGAAAWLYNISTATLNGLAPNEGKKDTVVSTAIPATAAPGGSWDWNDFSTVGLQLDMNKQAAAESTAAVLYVDAFGFLVTTNDTSCGGSDSTINPLPMTDTYDATKLQYLSANPPASAASTGVITWDNLGPLYAGGTITVQVNFKALATTTSATVNTAVVNAAKFSSGRPVNNATDNASVNINASFALSGRTWIDAGGTLGWLAGTGYDPIPATDQPLPNVKMDLYVCVGADGLPIAQDTNRNTACGAVSTESWQLFGTKYTDANGNYTFSGLRSGYYNVRANGTALPTGMTQRDGEASGAANGTGIGGNPCATCNGEWNEQATVVRNLTYLTAATTQVNFGYRNPTLGTVTGYVWNDKDQGGYNDWDSTEPPIPGTTVTLTCTGAGCAQPSYTTTTDQNGYYQFSGLNVGATATYRVVVTPPGGTGQTGDPNYTTGSCYGVPASCDNQTNTFTLTAGGAHGADLFGYYGGLKIGDTVYADWNGDGTQNITTEEGIAGVQVLLYLDSNGNNALDSGEPLLDTKVTDSIGHYEFTQVPGGSKYVVMVNSATLPAGYTQTGDPNEAGTCVTCDSKDPHQLGSTDYLNADFGYQPRGFGSIGDYVWYDTNGDGVQGATEVGVNNAAVRLYQDQNGNGVIDPEDALIATTATNAGGIYNFGNLPAGNFIVQIDPTAFNSSGPLAGYIMTTGGTPYNTSQISYAVPLGAGQAFKDADFGFASTAIGDFIWQDNNGDGLADTNEPGINGVVMKLYIDVNNNGTYDAGTDTEYGTTTTANKLVGSTNVPGYYLFSGMPPGNYIVQVDAINFTSGHALYNYTLTADPDAYSTTNPDSVSCLVAVPGVCDGVKAYDRYAAGSTNDENPAIRGGSNELTADFGYQPQGVLGDTVWIDSNNNGVRDATEPGIPNVTVWLCNSTPCTASTPGAISTVTDATGGYSFGSLSDGLAYYVYVDRTDPDFPAGLTQTYGTAEQTRTINTSVNNGVDLTVDFGYRFSGINSITGTVWNDGDSNKIIGGSETIRYSAVPIYLWWCVNGCGGTDDILIGSTTSASDGTYSFPGLADGTYRVVANSNAYTLRGTTTTTPVSVDNSGIDRPSAILSGGATAVRNFGYLSNMDLGDLPSTYQDTLLANNGARHTLVGAGQVYLGTTVTADPDGKESPIAAGDTDEGVVRTPSVKWTANSATGGSIDVTVGGCATTCYLSAWADWGKDNNFTGTDERILLDQPVTNSTQTLTFKVPADAFPNNSNTFNFRFRLYPSSTSGLAQPTGLATNGEVEDYQWSFGPTAVTLGSMAARAEAGDPLTLPIFILMGVGALLLIAWAKRHRVA